MTGRKLYDLVCDGWATTGDYWRARESNTFLPATPVAWMFLTAAEHKAFTHAASRITLQKRKPA